MTYLSGLKQTRKVDLGDPGSSHSYKKEMANIDIHQTVQTLWRLNTVVLNTVWADHCGDQDVSCKQSICNNNYCSIQYFWLSPKAEFIH